MQPPQMNVVSRSGPPAPASSWTRTWLHPDTGIVERLAFEGADGTPGTLPICASAWLRGSVPQEMGLGKGINPTGALVSAVGEAMEIFASSQFNSFELVHKSWRSLGSDSLDPQSLSLYEESAYDENPASYSRFDPQRPIHWVQGQWLGTDSPVLVPALPTFRYFPATPEERFCQVTSNGLACGFDFRDAALRATLELIERDALMITWLARLPQRELLFDEGLAPPFQEIVENVRQFGADVRLFVLKAGINVPVVLAVAFGDGRNWPGAVVGSGADLTLRGAAEKAILEIGQMGHYLRSVLRHNPDSIPARPESVRSMPDHSLYYLPKRRNSAFDFLSAENRSPVSLDFQLPAPDGATLEPGDPLDAVIHALEEAHLRVALVNLTTAALHKTPFTVVRALGENLQQNHFGHHLARTRNPRLRQFLVSSPNPDVTPLS